VSKGEKCKNEEKGDTEDMEMDDNGPVMSKDMIYNAGTSLALASWENLKCLNLSKMS
jgi:hypothetical protein